MPWGTVAAIAAQALPSVIAAFKKPGKPKSYEPSPWTEEVWGELQNMLSGNELQRSMERSSARQLGRAQTTGTRAITRNLGTDPALLASALQKLQETTARGSVQAGERASLAQTGVRERALGQMGTMGARRDALSLQQQQGQEAYSQDLWAGIIEGLGGVGSGYMQQQGLMDAVEALLAGKTTPGAIGGTPAPNWWNQTA